MKGLLKWSILLVLVAGCTPQGPLVSKASPTAVSPAGSRSPSPSVSPSSAASASPSQAPISPPQAVLPGAWAGRGTMSTPRTDFAAVALNGADVLLIGGETSSTTDTATVDLFQWPSDTFNPNPPPPMSTPRNGHTATLLPSGKVLVTGGSASPGGPALASAELYNPTSRTWSPGASMAQPRAHHVAVLLPNGKVLVVGGDGGSIGPQPTTNEVYDPPTNTWTSLATQYGDRPNGPIVLPLTDGWVMIWGGVAQVEPGNNLELYNPSTGQSVLSSSSSTWTSTSWSTAATLPDGTALIMGGQLTYQPAGALNTTSVYDHSQEGRVPETAPALVAGPAMDVGHCHHTTTPLRDGRLLLAGGRCGPSDSIAITEIYDPTAKKWTVVASLLAARGDHVAVMLGDGSVLVAGGLGQGGVILSSAEVYSPA